MSIQDTAHFEMNRNKSKSCYLHISLVYMNLKHLKLLSTTLVTELINLLLFCCVM